MSNRTPENQTAYYQGHPPKCIEAFTVEAAQLGNIGFDGHGSSGMYPDGVVENPNTVFAIRCQCGNSVCKIVGESEYQEIWRHENLVVAERYFLECGSCHSRHLLFDRYLHGYDAETSQLEGLSLSEIIGSDQPLPIKEKVMCLCSDCNNTTFEVFTRFEYPSDLFDESLFQGREQEFFSWFTGVGKCHTCSAINMFMDFECA
jgi:hypothetical protein